MGKNDRRLKTFPEHRVNTDVSTAVMVKVEKGKVFLKIQPASVGWIRMTPKKANELMEALGKAVEEAKQPPTEPETSNAED